MKTQSSSIMLVEPKKIWVEFGLGPKIASNVARYFGQLAQNNIHYFARNDVSVHLIVKSNYLMARHS